MVHLGLLVKQVGCCRSYVVFRFDGRFARSQVVSLDLNLLDVLLLLFDLLLSEIHLILSIVQSLLEMGCVYLKVERCLAHLVDGACELGDLLVSLCDLFVFLLDCLGFQF